MRRTALAVGLVATLVAGITAIGVGDPVEADAAPVAAPRVDFNGDGYGDMVVTGGDAASVLYGGPGGLDTARKVRITKDFPGLPAPVATARYFAENATPGDLDGDGYDDLVITSPLQKSVVVWGGARGLSGSALLSDGTAGGASDRGTVAGDFDGDGHEDLAIHDDYAGFHISRGPFSRTGVPAAVDRYAYQDIDPGFGGQSLVAGEVNGDGTTDLLLLGSIRRTPPKEGSYAGAILLLGSPGGLHNPRRLPNLGGSAAIGDVDGDGFGDVIQGAFLEGYNPAGVVGGSIVVNYGSATGLSTTRPAVRISQDTPGVPGTGETYDRFGFALATGDIDHDGYADVAVSSQQESISGVSTTGGVMVLRGSAKGLTGTGAVSYNQNSPGVPGANESYDRWGSSLLLTDMNRDGRSELVVGTEFENDDIGNAWYFPSSGSTLTTKGMVSFSYRTLGGTEKKHYTYFSRYMAP
ncbi:FG-GAP and VCBS repeat-containing protein [Streptomyces sp. NPDC127038]|uniref:FG-GAP and VCBS repeat-containing protein n=1 Tax=Streptomyces sp. NPDC127038 TaxID=3347114 RepID=UPI003661E486